MIARRYATRQLWTVLILLLFAGLTLTACQEAEPEATEAQGTFTQLLVRAPEGPLPRNRPITVRSISHDEHGISHVELYAVEMPDGNTNVLIRADKAPFLQTSFTVAQTFTPLQPGHYVIKVVGYNRLGESDESDFIGFDVSE